MLWIFKILISLLFISALVHWIDGGCGPRERNKEERESDGEGMKWKRWAWKWKRLRYLMGWFVFKNKFWAESNLNLHKTLKRQAEWKEKKRGKKEMKLVVNKRIGMSPMGIKCNQFSVYLKWCWQCPEIFNFSSSKTM